jgi:hypothetical protein
MMGDATTQRLVRPFVLLALVLAVTTMRAQTPPRPPIGIVDFYGLRHVSKAEAQAALRLAPGDPVPESSDEAKRRMRAVPGIADVHFNLTCCDNGKVILYVGVEEAGAPKRLFRAAPRAPIRLPEDVRTAGHEFEEAVGQAVLRGDSAEDDSNGHSLMHDAASRAIQERFVTFAARDLATVRDVLAHAAEADDRALAALVIAYAGDKRSVMPDLVAAMRDASADVRNNAMRAVWIIARLARRSPAAGIRVPYAPFVDLLNSPIWTDRNKSSLALSEISESRDPALLALLRQKALLSLIEMARWQSAGHAEPSFVLLGRAAGWSEDAIHEAWERGDREALIRSVK